MIEIVFLGTSCMVPTKERNVQGIFLSYHKEGLLIDCGEGTQRQMEIAGINRNRVTRVLISHWHGDHVSGLVGLIQTLGNWSKEEPKTLYLYGPKGTKAHLAHLLKSCVFENKLSLVVQELDAKKPKVFLETDDFVVLAANLQHTVPCLGFRFAEKDKRKMNKKKLAKFGIRGPLVGRLQAGFSIRVKSETITPDQVSSMVAGKIVSFVLDTGLCRNATELAREADLLVSEATLGSALESRAAKFKHLTARQAGQIANKAEAKQLILTHISPRYKTSSEVLEDVTKVYPNAKVAYDFMKVKL